MKDVMIFSLRQQDPKPLHPVQRLRVSLTIGQMYVHILCPIFFNDWEM